MDLLLRSFGILIPVSLLSLPPATVIWHLLAKVRSRTIPERVARSTAALDVALVSAAVFVVALVVMPLSRGSMLHLVPGTDLDRVFTNDRAFWQAAGNLLMLLPLGMLLPLRWRWWHSPARVVVAAFAASVCFELVQYALHVGRVTSTDDVLLNTIGAALGVSIVRRDRPRPYRGIQNAPAYGAIRNAVSQPR